MDKSRSLARIARGTRSGLFPQPVSIPALAHNATTSSLPARHMSSSTPSVIQPSFWKSLIPKPFRRQPSDQFAVRKPKPKSKEWNPATFFIIIFLFIGSMSIQMIALRRDFNAFTRRAEVRIGLLREVVEKLQRGEHVDVEKALGTGDAQKELEWEEVLREIERDDTIKNTQKTAKQKAATSQAAPTNQPISTSTVSSQAAHSKTASDSATETKKPANFSSFF